MTAEMLKSAYVNNYVDVSILCTKKFQVIKDSNYFSGPSNTQSQTICFNPSAEENPKKIEEKKLIFCNYVFI